MFDIYKERDTMIVTGGILVGMLLRYTPEQWAQGALIDGLAEGYKDHFRHLSELRSRIFAERTERPRPKSH